MTRAKQITVIMLALLVASTLSVAGLSKADKKEAKALVKGGPFYMMLDAPCAYGRHAYGTYKRALVEISPVGVNTEGDQAMSYGWWHADSTYWGININDAVKITEVDFEDAEVVLEFDGVGKASGNDSKVKFVDVESLSDFKAAFEKTFSPTPLQEQHEDWSEEIKEAIADRRMLNGMSKRQVFYVTGSPERFEKTEEDGATVEIWFLRTDKGMKMGYWGSKGGEGTGMPGSLRFVDGKLVDLSEAGGGDALSLDD